MPAPGSKGIPPEISEANLFIWREAMTHLRHLSDDVLKGLRLFLGLNAVLLGALLFLLAYEPFARRWICLAGLVSCLGILLTIAARFILKRNRIYYLEMLAKKSLIEHQAGFYSTKLAGSNTDLAFPWRLKPEVVAEIVQDFDAWVQKSIRAKGTIARVHFMIYEVLLGVYFLLFGLALLRLLR